VSHFVLWHLLFDIGTVHLILIPFIDDSIRALWWALIGGRAFWHCIWRDIHHSFDLLPHRPELLPPLGDILVWVTILPILVFCLLWGHYHFTFILPLMIYWWLILFSNYTPPRWSIHSIPWWHLFIPVTLVFYHWWYDTCYHYIHSGKITFLSLYVSFMMTLWW